MAADNTRAIVEALAALPDLRRVSRLWIERDPESWWLGVRYAGMLDVAAYAERAPEPDGWEPAERVTITYDGDVPPGVGLEVLRCYPSVRHRLPLVGADPQDAVMAMLVALEASGLVGRLDLTRMESVTLDAITRRPWPVWLISTHAGSDAERHAWLLGLDRG